MSVSDADRVVGRSSPFPGGRQCGTRSPSPSASLTDRHLADALANSPDNGATLDFTHKTLTDVGEDGAERLATAGRGEFAAEATPIARIALSYNRLATLPTAFALLSRLRYLNLRNNSFSVFPDVLTIIPSLEILDISRNKIKRLPAQSGSLSRLRVLCLSRNRITRLPGYLADFGNLGVLRVDHNPIEWPPKATIDMDGSPDDPQAVKDWILALQSWIRENSQPCPDAKPKPSVESFMSERAALNHSIEESLQSWSALGEGDLSGGPTPHPLSVDDHLPLPPVPLPSKSAIGPRFERPPPLRLGSLPPYDPPSRSASPESYLPTPEESVSSVDDDHTAVLRGTQHQRNGSFAHISRDRRPALFGRKCIPDLHTPPRLSAQPLGSAPSATPPGPPSYTNGTSRHDFMPSDLVHRQDSSSSSSEGCSQQQKLRKQCTTTPPSSASPTSAERSHTVPDVERHAYFKRLSALPANATNLPPPLRSLVECARSIYFSVSQVYQALSHYTTYTIDQKLSSVLRKITDPAHTYMTQLNSALERFDTVEKKTTPPPLLCRALVESSRDSAAVFGKAVAMLSLQLKILASRDDDRYMRSLVLIFYGAAAEISRAWRSMIPHIEAVKPYLSDPRRIPPCKSHTLVPPTLNIDTSSPVVNVGSSQLLGFHHNIPIARSRPTPTTLGRVRTTRRHAGSFSSKDVEIGKSLPSNDPFPPVFSNSMSLTTRRPAQRAPSAPLSASTSSLVPSSVVWGAIHGVSLPMSASQPRPAWTSRNEYHSRRASQASLTASSSSSLPHVPIRKPTLEIPLSRTLVDNDALDSMETAVDSAPAIWELMLEMVESMLETPGLSGDFRDSIDKAKIVTERLRVNIVAVRAGDPTADRRALRDNAHLFVKIVVKLSNFIKTYGSSHAVFPDLRSRMVALTNSTQEFVMLLHVSSFSPSSPTPYSPMVSAPVHSTGATANFRGPDDKLGMSTSRWNTHQPKALKLVTPGLTNLARSALPSQSQFHVVSTSRYPIPLGAGLVGYGNGGISKGDTIVDEG